MKNLLCIIFISFSFILSSEPIKNYNQLAFIGNLGQGAGTYEPVKLYEVIGTNKVVAVKSFEKGKWQGDAKALYYIGKSPLTTGLVSVIKGKARRKGDASPVWIIMEPYLGGTLENAVEHYRYSDLQEKIKAIEFYLANMGIILDNIHNQAHWAWEDVKPQNVLLDSQTGYLVATDFGRSTNLLGVTNQQDFIADDWEQLGRRILGDEGFKVNQMMGESYNNLKDIMIQLMNRKITSLKDMKKHQFFRDFDWETMKDRKLTAPYIPACQLIHCNKLDPYRMSLDEPAYIDEKYQKYID